MSDKILEILSACVALVELNKNVNCWAFTEVVGYQKS